jgi:hypothetical protein
MLGAPIHRLLITLACVLATGASASPAIARARVGCPHRTVAPVYHLTRPIARGIRRDFLRRHRGYRIVTVVTSVLAPQGCVGVYYLRPGGQDGSYSTGGVAYYDHGRAVNNPSRAAVVGMHAVAAMTAVSQGAGTYTFTETGADAVGGVATFSGRTSFQWTNVYGNARRPFELGAMALGENLAGGGAFDSSRVTGLSSYSYSDSSDPSENFACQLPLNASGSTDLQWYPFARTGRRSDEEFKGMRFGEEFHYLTVRQDGQPPGEPSDGGSCDESIPPLDPNPTATQDYLQIGFDHMLPSPSIAGNVVAWPSFTAPVAIHHHKQLDGDPSTGAPASVQDLSMTGTIQFLLRGVRPAG